MKKQAIFAMMAFILSGCIEVSNYQNQQEIVSSMAQTLTHKYPEIPEILAPELKRQLEDKSFFSLIVDLRDQREFAISTLPNALPLSKFSEILKGFRARGENFDKEVIVFTTIGLGAHEYAQALMAQKIKVKNLKGGTLSWAQNNYPFIEPSTNTPTFRVGIESEAWNILPKNYTGVLP